MYASLNFRAELSGARVVRPATADVTVRAPIARWFTATICVVCFALLLASAPFAAAQSTPAPTSLFGTNIIARGKGVLVRQSQLDDLFISFKVTRTALGQVVPDNLRKQIEVDLLDKLIVFQLCEGRVTEAEKADAGKRTDQLIAAQIKQAGSQAAFERQLQMIAAKPETLRAQLIQQAIFEIVIARELRPTLTATEEEERAFYTNNPALFNQPERIRINNIFISSQNATNGQPLSPEEASAKRRIAQTVQGRAKAGESFTNLVQAFTDAGASKSRNGEYLLTRAKDDPSRAMPVEFESTAFTLGTNQISDVIVTDSGFHIFKLLEKLPAEKVEFASAKTNIHERLIDDKMQKAMPAFATKLKQEAEVEILKKD